MTPSNHDDRTNISLNNSHPKKDRPFSAETLNYNDYILRQTQIKKGYQQNIAHFGYNAKSLGWFSKASQEKRFELLVNQISDWNNLSILDVGCGFADFYDYLQQKTPPNTTLHYHGIDSNKKHIEEAKRRYPSIQVRCEDILQHTHNYDVIVASGLLNHRYPSHRSYFRLMAFKLQSLTKKYCLINLLSHKTQPQHNEVFFYYTKKDITQAYKEHTDSMTITHHQITPNTFDYNVTLTRD